MVRNMAFEVGAEIGNRRVLVAVHTKDAPSDAEWNAWLAFIEPLGEEVGQDLARLPNLVVTDGGAPSTAQRTAVNMLVAQGKTLPPVAVVTDSLLVRTVLRGISIFNPATKAFAPTELGQALDHLGIPASAANALAAVCVRMGKSLGRVRTTELIVVS